MRRWKLSKLVRITDDTHAHVWPSRKSSSCKKMMMNSEFTPLFLARLIFAFIACSVCSFKEHLQRVNFIYHSRLKDSPSWSDSVLRIAGECSLCPWRESFFSGLLTLFLSVCFWALSMSVRVLVSPRRWVSRTFHPSSLSPTLEIVFPRDDSQRLEWITVICLN